MKNKKYQFLQLNGVPSMNQTLRIFSSTDLDIGTDNALHSWEKWAWSWYCNWQLLVPLGNILGWT
jgi:hypothetical protein